MSSSHYTRNSDSGRHGRGSSTSRCNKAAPIKKVLTFQELELHRLTVSGQKAKSECPHSLTPSKNNGNAATPKVLLRSNSPLRQRIRQSILKHDEYTPSPMTSVDSKVSSFPDDTDSSPEHDAKTRTQPRQQQQPRRTFLEQRVHEMRVAKLADARLSPREAAITPIIHPQNSPSASSTAFFTPSPAHDSIQPKTTTSGRAGPMSSRAFSLVKERRRAAANTRTPPLPSSAPPTTAVTSSVSRINRPVRTPVGSITPKKNPPRTTTPRDNYDSGPSTRRNLDKKTVRLLYSKDFSNQIDQYRQESIHAALTPKLNKTNNDTLKLFVRKRPIFAKQVEQGDFDVVEILDPEQPGDAATAVVVYKTTMNSDMKTKVVQPFVFSGCIAAAFSDQATSEQVYQTAVRPLVQSILQSGSKAATLLMFGQTGSGKTYTMNACQKLVAAEIFADRSVEEVRVQCLELVGKKCCDLMVHTTRHDNKQAVVEIRDNSDGSVDFINASTTYARYPREILSALVAAQKNRSTHSTEVNDVSSRSHAVYQLRIIKTNQQTSVLTLLDCAGTERRHDSLYHSQERQSESTEINASLYALKECIRIRSQNSKTKKHVHVPYRSSNLTRILRESLECPYSRLHVIATVSPNATDTEHTIHTLKTISTLTGGLWEERDSHQWVSSWRDGSYNSSPELKAPKKMTHPELVEWLEIRNLLGKSQVPTHIDGKGLMKMSKIQLKYLLYDDSDSKLGNEKAELLFKSLRAETERVTQDEHQRRRLHAKSQ